jgi:hypothetical protein
MRFNLELANYYEFKTSNVNNVENEVSSLELSYGFAAIAKMLGDRSLVSRVCASFEIRKQSVPTLSEDTAIALLQHELAWYKNFKPLSTSDANFASDICLETKLLAFGCRWGWSLIEINGRAFIVDIPNTDGCKVERGKCKVHQHQYCYANKFVECALGYSRRLDFLFDR